MKIAVIGAGAIGGLVAGYLKLKGNDVTLVGRPDAVKAIKADGLRISGVRGELDISLPVCEALSEKVDLAILATKTQDLESALKTNIDFIRDALVLTTQNGLQADSIVSGFIPKEKIISSIVMFGSTYLKPGEIVHNFDKSWIIGKAFGRNDDSVVKVSHVLNTIFPTIVSEEILGMKYLKVFVNSNNCIPAILGVSMQEVFSDVDICAVSVAIWKEGLSVMNKAGISLSSLPDFPLERVTKLAALSLPEAAKIFSGIMTNLSREPMYGSILQSIKRGKNSEIDYINGEFVALAKKNNAIAPLNEKLVEMVHQVEPTGKFFSKQELLDNTKGLY
ncbi:MAG: 2-dehydropantoate 2-reductase [Candidatus Omnitrophica bacterium]|nr:2-dehydropantoate 2-reductase [Candidatus Omnitrophota bacterium]